MMKFLNYIGLRSLIVILVIFIVPIPASAEYSSGEFKEDLAVVHELRMKLLNECSNNPQSPSCIYNDSLTRMFYRLSLLAESELYGKEALSAEIMLSDKDSFREYKELITK